MRPKQRLQKRRVPNGRSRSRKPSRRDRLAHRCPRPQPIPASSSLRGPMSRIRLSIEGWLPSVGQAVGALPAFLLLNHPSGLIAQLGQLGLVAMIGLYGGAQPTIMVETAPLPVRCTAVALGYNISLGVIGGLTPLVATWLVNRTGQEIAPAFLIMAAAAVTFATLLWFRETYRAPFIGGSSGAAAAYA